MSDDLGPTFIVDNMLGSLARWLRMLGYDSKYDRNLSDNGIIELARAEGRRILTRDRELAEKGGGLYISSTSLDEQLQTVAKKFSLRYRPELMRCSVCNGRLLETQAASVEKEIPEKSLMNATEFWRCSACEKIYWNGTHWNGILDRFNRLGLVKGDPG